MPEGWVPYAIIAGVATALAAVTVVLARLTWRRQVRRFVVGLLGRREAIGAALRAIDGVIRGLAAGTVDTLLEFASAESDERHAVGEIAQRMRIESAELADLALPKRLWPLADCLQAAATALATQAAGVGDGEGEPVLDALAEIDLDVARAALRDADDHIVDASMRYGLTDSAVYGGGLYI